MPFANLLRRSMLVLALLSLGATAVWAIHPGEHTEDHFRHEIPLPWQDPTLRTPAADNAGRGVEAALTARYGGQWKVQAWNNPTGTPRWVFGSPVAKAGAITSADQVATLAKDVVRENADVLGTAGLDLRVERTPHGDDKWAAHLQQYWNDHRVWEGLVRVVFHENGNLMLMGSTVHPEIDLDPRPALSPAAAADAAVADLPFDPGQGDSYAVDPGLLVLPVPVSETAVTHHLVYRVHVTTSDPLGEWVTHVDAHDGEVVWRYNNIHFFEGTASADVQPGSWCNGVQNLPLAYLNLSVTGLGSTTTAADGSWSIAGGAGTAAVTAVLQGPYVRVFNQNGAEAAYNGVAVMGTPLDVVWDDANSRQDERDVFEAVNAIHTFYQEFDGDFSYVNQPISAYVNRNDGFCPGNAWWNGTINFCAAGGSYSNTGELQQVVQHEFGHGVQDAVMGGWQGNEGLGEGNSDILGNLMTQDPVIGRGFYTGNCSSGIRNSQNSLQYPQDLNGSVHHDGQIIAGFNWDAMELLQSRLGQEAGTILSASNWHFGRLLLSPSTQPDQVIATFTADDDDGDLTNGTPYHDIYTVAAENHGFGPWVPEILVGMFVYHDGAPYQTDTFGPYRIVCTGSSLGGGEVDPSSFELRYTVDGGLENTVPMVAQGNEFIAELPGQPAGSVVRYYISALNTLGDLGTSPRNAPEDLHYFEINDQFEDTMELATGWRAGALDDNATTGQWERGVPTGTFYDGLPVQLGSDHTPAPGVNCWVTGAFHSSGSAAGENDVDGGRTTLFSPVFDLTDGENILIAYERYYTNERGAAPSQDLWRVDISNDGGQTWTSVESTNLSNATWQPVSFPLSDYFSRPGLVQLRFIAEDAGDGSLVEAMVDDFTLVGEFLDPTPVEGAPELRLAFELQQNHPNPFNPSTRVAFSLDRGGPASLQVFDARGRHVRTLVDGDLPAGAHTVTWSGDDAQGRPVSSGVYFYRLVAGDQQAERRMLLVK
jgi:Zn-dependent metalloprotease